MGGAAAKRPCPHGREQSSNETTPNKSVRAPPAHVQREAPFKNPSESEAFVRSEATCRV